jgi:hypothetical protein
MIENRLRRIRQYIAIFSQLVKFLGPERPKALSVAALRFGQPFIDAFIKLIPLLSSNFIAHRPAVLGCFSGMQVGTRVLQVLLFCVPCLVMCCWSVIGWLARQRLCDVAKLERDVAMTALVPGVKQQLELLVYKVQYVLQENDCSDAIHIGMHESHMARWLSRVHWRHTNGCSGVLRRKDLSGNIISSQVPQSDSEPDDDDDDDDDDGYSNKRKKKQQRVKKAKKEKAPSKRKSSKRKRQQQDDDGDEDDAQAEQDDDDGDEEQEQDDNDDNDDDETSYRLSSKRTNNFGSQQHVAKRPKITHEADESVVGFRSRRKRRIASSDDSDDDQDDDAMDDINEEAEDDQEGDDAETDDGDDQEQEEDGQEDDEEDEEEVEQVDDDDDDDDL